MKKTIKFRLEFNDFIDSHYLSNHKRFISISKFLIMIAVFVLVLLFVFFSMHFLSLVVSRSVAQWSLAGLIEYIMSYQDFLVLALIVVGPLFLLRLGVDLLIRFRVWLMLKRNPDVTLSERAIEITDVGVHYFTSKAESNIKWEYFNHVLENHEYFLLMKSPDDYVIIPKRGFVESIDAEQFREYLGARLRISQVNK